MYTKQVATLQSAYECLQESAAQREKHEEDEKARLQQEVGELRATTAKLSARTVSASIMPCVCLTG